MYNEFDVLVLHHNDADGICSGAICKHFEEQRGNRVETYRINYGYDVPWGKIKKARKVYMVDFCFQPFKDMLKLYEMKGKNFIWIDHHKSAIEDWEKSGQPIEGIREIGKAGCELTWEYFSDKVLPTGVKMIGRHDVWDSAYHPESFIYFYGIELLNIHADDTSTWEKIFNNDPDFDKEIVNSGKIIDHYRSVKDERYCRSNSFDLEWEGLKFLATNILNTTSKAFESRFNHEDYDAIMAFGFTNGGWSVSMYTDKPGIDVGTIAKRYGGGGHAGACRFRSEYTLPFDLPMKG